MSSALAHEVDRALEDRELESPSLENDPELDAFVSTFRKMYGNNLLAVLLTGSYLSSHTRSEDSFRDFFCIVDTYKNTGHIFSRLFHRVLPPDLYHVRLSMPDGREVDCKYYLISTDHLVQATGPEAKDLYVLGRLSKRVACVYARNLGARALVMRSLASATEQAVRTAASLAEKPLDDDSFYKLVLQISYMAERRLEDDRKIESLFRAGDSYYRRVYGKLVEKMVEEGELIRDRQTNLVAGPESMSRNRQTKKFIKKSRRRAKARWPKMIITLDNWQEMLMAKLERTHGIKIDLPPWERKFPLITGWRHYFRLKREGKIR
ncbi:MAG: hypothetical protein R6V10_00015 [bacterium]